LLHLVGSSITLPNGTSTYTPNYAASHLRRLQPSTWQWFTAYYVSDRSVAEDSYTREKNNTETEILYEYNYCEIWGSYNSVYED